MKFKISHNDYSNLCYEIEKSLSAALTDLSQHEPQLVANMVWHIPKHLNRTTFNNKGFKIQSGGIFVHQKPQVRYADFPEEKPASVEIGDLLFLRTEKQNGKVSSRSALLLQAKKFSKLPVTPDNENQRHLYAYWPPFKYVRSTSSLNGKKRYVTGPDLYNAAKYLLIGKDSRCFNDWPFCHRFFHLCSHRNLLTAHPSHPEISQYRCFAVELADFILGDAGKPYQSPPPKWTRNWDRVIHDLKVITGKAASVYMDRASSGKSVTRGQCLFFQTGFLYDMTESTLNTKTFSEDEVMHLDGPPEVPPADFRDDSNEGGVSIIEFVVSTEEERRS